MKKMAAQQIILKAATSRYFRAGAGSGSGSYASDCRTLFTNFSSKFPNSPVSSVRLIDAPLSRFLRRAAASSEKIKEPSLEKIKVLRKKKRLDEVCLERFQQYSRTFIQSWIVQGKVFVDGKVVNKCGAQISDKSVVDIQAEVPKYVCRAGHKLEAALEQLEIDVTGKVALDSGLSTGGFTDCLLQYGASFVYGVDVGYGQVAEKIRKHERVSVIERTNLRYLSELPQKVDIVTLDLAFISILMVMPAVISVMKDDAVLLTLIKPQFEAHRSQVGRGGIVKDPLVHQEVVGKIINGVQGFGFECQGWIDSPLKGADGNKEFLASFSRTAVKNADPPAEADIARLFRSIETKQQEQGQEQEQQGQGQGQEQEQQEQPTK